MHLNDALIDNETGAPVIRGTIEMRDSLGYAKPLPPHSMFLLDARNTWLKFTPVTTAQRLQSDFYQVTLADTELQISLDSQAFYETFGKRDSAELAIKKGSGTQGVVKSRLGDPAAMLPVYGISSFDVSSQRGAEGLAFKIAGGLMPWSPQGDMPSPDDGFAIKGVVPWETLTTKGYPVRGAHLFTPQGQRATNLDKPNVTDPTRLGDLMIAEGLTWPYVTGTMKLTRDRGNSDRPAKDFLCIFVEPERLRFNNIQHVELLTNGFYRSSGSGRHWLELRGAGRNFLEAALRKKDNAKLMCEGDLLGSLHLPTPYGESPADPLASIRQTIRSYKYQASLGKAGLHLGFAGRLHEFDPVEFDEHRQLKNSKMVPWEAFELRTTLPWALLKVRDFQIAARVSEFG